MTTSSNVGGHIKPWLPQYSILVGLAFSVIPIMCLVRFHFGDTMGGLSGVAMLCIGLICWGARGPNNTMEFVFGIMGLMACILTPVVMFGAKGQLLMVLALIACVVVIAFGLRGMYFQRRSK